MSKYTNALYPDKINDLVDNDGNLNPEVVPAGGTKLYKHTILLSGTTTNYAVTLILTTASIPTFSDQAGPKRLIFEEGFGIIKGSETKYSQLMEGVPPSAVYYDGVSSFEVANYPTNALAFSEYKFISFDGQKSINYLDDITGMVADTVTEL